GRGAVTVPARTQQPMSEVAMSEPHLTAPEPTVKPAKPSPDFPLFPHAAGVWAKKIRGKLYYFGPWNDPEGALAKYLEQKDALHAGGTPRPATGGLTVRGLCNEFLTVKKALVDAGELTPRSWGDYKENTDLLVADFGKGRLVDDLGPDDFTALRDSAAKRGGPVPPRHTIQRVRSVFKCGTDNGLLERSPRYGQGFKRPSARTLRVHRAEQGPKLFAADEIRRLLAAAGVPMRAMILLGINCGLGNADCGNL